MSLTILHWNILANCFAKNEEKGFPYVQPEYLNFAHRFNLITKKISSFNPDIFDCVEVDFFELLSNHFQADYLSFYQQKPDGKDGTAIFLKASRFQVLQKKIYPLHPQHSQFALILKIYDKISKNDFQYVAVHLKAKPEFAEVRKEEINNLFKILKNSIRDSFEGVFDYLILAGDFNDTPDSEIYQILEKEFQNAHPKNLISTCKMRNVQVEEDGKKEIKPFLIKRTIDYIWLKNFQVRKMFQNFIDLESPGLPNAINPSDHLLLAVEIAFG